MNMTIRFLLLVSVLLLGLSLSANPVGPKVVQGTASITSSGSLLTIQTSDRTLINWNSFNIAAGEITTFVQPSSSSVAWNRINDPNPSQILGNLNANGYIILQNPAGFYVGGQAAITAHGIIMTTAPTPPPDLSGGGPWQFNTPPPAASIINYGQLKQPEGDTGGSIFLIGADIQNKGTLSSPQGNVGLIAGKDVLVSSRPDGRGLIAKATLPQGSVDNQGRIIADAGTIAIRAQVVNQAGLVQADSVRNVNGLIELVASDALTLAANSVVSAKGDATSQSVSPGGFVVLSSDNAFSDLSGSKITVSGQSGGPDGLVQVFGNGTSAASMKTTINDLSAAAYSSSDHLLMNTYDLNLSADPTDTSSSSPNLSVYDLSAYSKIALLAKHDININTWWSLADSLDPQALLSLSASRNITLLDGSAIQSGNNWNLNFAAGTGLVPGSLPQAGTDGIYLRGNSFIESQNGDIDLWAANEVLVATGSSTAVMNNGIRSLAGGSINVTAAFGSVNTGGNPSGYIYQPEAPYYYVSTDDSAAEAVGGISTAAGGNVTISAGRDVTSYLAVSTSGLLGAGDGGSGAFGPEPGNVSISAGGSVYGHYMVANGSGTITAGKNVGGLVASQNLALSLISGGWTVNAPNGNIYLQEVRNPNGVFNNQGNFSSPGRHLFDYAPDASVTLNAGIGVYFTELALPRPSDAVPSIYPPILSVSSGSGGVTLQDNLILFPSSDQDLTISTTGNLAGQPNRPFTQPQLIMSDSGRQQWQAGSPAFGAQDHGPLPLGLEDPTAVQVNIAGNMDNLTLITTKQTTIAVGGDMNNCGFSGQNLHGSDVTSIDVGGKIYNRSPYSFTFLDHSIPGLPAADLPGGRGITWAFIFNQLLNPAIIANLQIPANLDPSAWAALASGAALFAGTGGSANPGFVYDPSTGRLGFQGQMLPGVRAAMELPAVVLRYNPDGTPATYIAANGNRYFVTDQINFIPASAVETLYNASQGAPSATSFQTGYRIGGPGTFDIQADSISLGNSVGILSCGAHDTQGGFARYQNLASVTPSGATVDVTVEHNLDMLTSTIAAIGGGNVNVTSIAGSMDLGSQELFNTRRELGFGIYASGRGDVNVLALGDINIDGSRIASYNGGDIFVKSLSGNINAGTGGTSFVGVEVSYVDPLTGKAGLYGEQVFGSGIVANTLVKPSQVTGAAVLPGNITVETPQGSIFASQGGILQEALNGNLSAGPTITLLAGTRPSGNAPGFHGDIDLGQSGVIGGTVNADANGNITGLVISRQNSTINAAQSFSGVVLSGGTANLSAGGTISGTIVGVGGINAAGGQGVSATLLSQNVSVAGGQAQSTLGTAASATAASQSASQQANAETQRPLAAGNSTEDDKKKEKARVALRRVSRVTVILPRA
jgi:filamentous hemagglutinin family protein